MKENSEKNDSAINLFEVSLAFSALDHSGIVTDRYFNHVDKLVLETKKRHVELLAAGANNDAGTQLAALKHILHDKEGYDGDVDTYDDLQNADIIRVIDRRKGMPIALCVLYIHVGRSNGWDLSGINFPGHFLCSIQKKSSKFLFDPFFACRLMEAQNLRALLKKTKGKDAELSVDYYQPCNNKEILFRLQNNVKLRMIGGEDYEGALKVVETMRLLDSNEYRLCLDAGVLYIKTGRLKEARDVLEKYKKLTPYALDRVDAERLIGEIDMLERGALE